ncbi:MAG: DNA polymerase III subunit delta [Coriobacteriia bacterium]|nr:DNA polymerase III subunit delta [Coriobacteriia bacterium]
MYLFISEQELLLDRELYKLKRDVGKLADLDFNSEMFDGENASGDDIVAACNTLPFASERRLVVVRNVEKLNKDDAEALVTYVQSPAESTILALAAKKLAKNTRLYKAAEKSGSLVVKTAPKASELPAEVQSMFSKRGRTITRDGAELLVRSVGQDLWRLSAEVDKAVAFVGNRKEVSASDIEQITATTAATSVFELGAALGDRDAARALRLLDRLVGDGESVYGIHAMALRQIRDLIAARALLDRGEGSTASIAAALGRPDWQVRNLPRQAKNYSSDELVGALRAACESEAQMKTSRDARLVFECWIVKVCS